MRRCLKQEVAYGSVLAFDHTAPSASMEALMSEDQFAEAEDRVYGLETSAPGCAVPPSSHSSRSCMTVRALYRYSGHKTVAFAASVGGAPASWTWCEENVSPSSYSGCDHTSYSRTGSSLFEIFLEAAHPRICYETRHLFDGRLSRYDSWPVDHDNGDPAHHSLPCSVKR